MKTGSRIKMLRTSLGLTQQAVADYLNVSRELISMIENNEREMALSNLEKLADLFGVELIDLIDESHENVTVSAALAFRADELTNVDLEQIARFRNIIKNYIRMDKILNESGDGGK